MPAPLFQTYDFYPPVFVLIGRNECHSFCFNAAFGGDWEPPMSAPLFQAYEFDPPVFVVNGRFAMILDTIIFTILSSRLCGLTLQYDLLLKSSTFRQFLWNCRFSMILDTIIFTILSSGLGRLSF